MRTKGIRRQNVSQFIDSREGDESELSTCELRGGNDKGRRVFLSFFYFFFLFLKREREFSLREWGKNSLVWDWVGIFGIQMIRSFSNFVWHVDDNVIFCFVEFPCVWWIRFINWMWNLNHCHIWEKPHNDIAINFWQFMNYVLPGFTMNIYCIKVWKQLKD